MKNFPKRLDIIKNLLKMHREGHMKEIVLKGGHSFLTQEKQYAYRIMQGQVLVYIVPYKNQKTGRRQLIWEAASGEEIPALNIAVSESDSFCFLLVALENATIEERVPEDMALLKLEFAKKTDTLLRSAQEFEYEMAERYNMNLVKEEAGIYATAVEQKKTYQNSLSVIYNLFQKKNRKTYTERSGNKIYDATAQICSYMGLNILPYDVVKESCKNKITVRDIARISHFPVRRILLEEGWFKKDMGPIMAYAKNGKKPIACLPQGPGKYVAYDVEKDSRQFIREDYAAGLEIEADMFYKTFPTKEIKVKDLVRLGFQSVYKRDFVNFSLLALIGTIIGLLVPMMNQQLYDKFIPMGSKSSLVQMCMVILACALGNLSFTVVKNLAVFRSMNTMEYAVQSATYDRMFNLPESFFGKYDSAELIQRAMGVSSIFRMCSDTAVKTVLSAGFSLLYLWRMFKYSKDLSKISIIMVLIFAVLIGWIGFRGLKYEEQKMALDGKISSKMYQFLAGISKIRIAGVENRVLYEYLKPYAQSRELNIRKESLNVLVNSIVGASQIIFSMVLYYIMIKKSLSLSMGAFMAFTTAFSAFSGAMLEVVSSFLSVNAVIPAYKRAKLILSEMPEYEEDTVMPGDISGSIEISHVTFGYNKEMEPVLSDLSFQIKSGEYIGIVGSSGCGKSTLLKLLLGFEKPDQGKIFYDGKDIDSVDKRELRKKFGVVLQNGSLISGSIYENIAITAPNTNMDQVKKVVEAVGLKEDIEAMPMGLHTVLSENSGTISGGQKQRILIARAIVGNPKVLFFDEATSALDNMTQAMVCESLSALHATRMVIAHRLSTVMDCDRILVMDKGRIIEEGSFSELMDRKGMFYQLAIRQMN